MLSTVMQLPIKQEWEAALILLCKHASSLFQVYFLKTKLLHKLKRQSRKHSGSKGEEIVKKNYEAVDQNFGKFNLRSITQKLQVQLNYRLIVSDKAPDMLKLLSLKLWKVKRLC
jgi:hypothetical protein